MDALFFALREETKSSAGDKYETSRSMINLEKEKVEKTLLELIRKKQAINQIYPKDITQKVKVGSLVTTTAGIFLISTSLGKVTIEEKDVFVISPISPIAQVMLDLAFGDGFEFKGKKDSILNLS